MHDHVAVTDTGGPRPSRSAALVAAPVDLVSYAQVLTISEFRAIFAAQTTATLSNVIVQITLAILVFRESGSPLLSSLTFALGFAPYLLGATLLSALADRFPVRSVMVVSHVLSCVTIGLMAVPHLPISLIMLLLIVLGAAAPVFQGARAAGLPEILGEAGYTLGRSLLRLVSQSTQIIGFAAGGLLLVIWTPGQCLLLAATGFGIAALLVQFGTLWRPPRGSSSRLRKSLARSSLHGVGQVLAVHKLRPLLLLTWLPPLFVVAPEALATPYARQMGAGTVVVGLLLCAAPAGSVIGELSTGLLVSSRVRVKLMFPFAVMMLAPLLIFVIRPRPIIAIALLTTCGLGFTYAMGLDQRVLDATPEEIRGQTLTLTVAGLMTGQGVGFALAGAVAEVVPPNLVIATAGATGLSALLLGGLLLSAQNLRDQPTAT